MNLGIVVPCYNEKDVLVETTARLLTVLTRLQHAGKVDANSGICFVDDGSSDETWALIEELSALHSAVRGIKLSRNRGHQNALIAGLLQAPGDAITSLDADLQDDIDVIETMVDAFHGGYDVVYGVRENRDTDSIFKRWSAESYYRLLRILGVEVVFNHADYRLLSRRVLDCLRDYREVNLFLRGIVPTLGFKSTEVSYTRSERLAGKSKYPLSRMLGLALDGVTSFSAVPLRLITITGLLVFLLSMASGIWALWVRLVAGSAVPGWASTVVPFYFLGGVQLLCIGIIGEYLAKVYIEIKGRPRYHVERLVGLGQRTGSRLAGGVEPRPVQAASRTGLTDFSSQLIQQQRKTEQQGDPDHHATSRPVARQDAGIWNGRDR